DWRLCRTGTAEPSALVLRTARGLPRKPEKVGYSHQIGSRANSHLVPDFAAMELDANLADPEFPGDLFGHQAMRHQRHDPLLTRAERVVSGAHIAHRLVVFAPRPILVECFVHRIQKVLAAYRLGQKFDGSGLHGFHGHWDVAVTGDEDDRNVH